MKESEKPDTILQITNLLEKIFTSLWNADSLSSWHWILFIVTSSIIILVASAFIIKSTTSLIENILKAFETYKSSGLPLWTSRSLKIKLRKRKQFSGVLDADLSYLAKAESWNDQYFTDLEAEVETEGGYYASAWARLRRRKSFGLRKERSLIKAITSSAERAMQLVGEPGSGKSVALRHLAKQLAEQGRKSNDKRAIVPLYINLREMESCPKSQNTSKDIKITADDIKSFVLENIRRGDADTTAFVKENWDDYCNRGIWLFLFDSFDEIPDVLHAEAGSGVIRQYSDAIRQFLEGMGECKGILASREFKGPEALPWKKLRILPLSEEKQDELIDKSFLERSQMSLVRQHLASSHSSIGTTPLFLTLLCRFIRDEKAAPHNDHDILLRHIERLANREPEYLQKKYNLTPKELVDGAERLAQLFAENEALSLAPTFDQLLSHLPPTTVHNNSIENLISALVDCKIGRTDVPNAARGDRRFAFAHRRYQESLFVRYLANNPEALSPTELLTNSRWREYTATLLQTKEIAEIEKLLEFACDLIKEYTLEQGNQNYKQINPIKKAGFYNWENEKAIPLLNLLQEGLSRRVQDTPEKLSEAIRVFLEPRWLQGDSLDRCNVIRLGGLLPQKILTEYIVDALNSGTRKERAAAFKQATFVLDIPISAKASILKTLSDRIILAQDRAEQLSLEALAARLPKNMGAHHVVNRGNRIRRNLKGINKISQLSKAIFPIRPILKIKELPALSKLNLKDLFTEKQKLPETIDLILPVTFTFPAFVISAIHYNITQEKPSLIVAGISLAIILTYLPCLFYFIARSHSREITASALFKITLSTLTDREKLSTFIKACTVICVLIIVFRIAGWAADKVYLSILDKRLFDIVNPGHWYFIIAGLVSLTLIMEIVAVPFIAVSGLKKWIAKRSQNLRLKKLKEIHSSDLEILYYASNIEELKQWFRFDEKLLTNVSEIRYFSGLALYALRELKQIKTISPKILEAFFIGEEENFSADNHKIKQIRQIIENRLVKAKSVHYEQQFQHNTLKD